ncbi:hypothetical protein BAU07_01615 [Bordetella flabilis]|uniref:Uncharacterized protein n=1 Tax=Bordetella flabilis TaxID=463014 RepID=A0A193G836_9BORD|nr:hypothetical protein BAU07_01615 [Bordetella flabilis]
MERSRWLVRQAAAADEIVESLLLVAIAEAGDYGERPETLSILVCENGHALDCCMIMRRRHARGARVMGGRP